MNRSWDFAKGVAVGLIFGGILAAVAWLFPRLLPYLWQASHPDAIALIRMAESCRKLQ